MSRPAALNIPACSGRCPIDAGMPPRTKIAKLPENIRAWLRRAIVEHGFGDITALTAELNALCREGGHDVTIGRSAVGAESQRVRRAQEAIRATTEAARLIAETSADAPDRRSEATMAMVQGEVFQVMLQIQDARDSDDPAERLKLMANVAKSISQLSRARVNQARWAEEWSARAKAAADKVARMAKDGGASPAIIRQIKEEILGIAARRPAQAEAAGA